MQKIVHKLPLAAVIVSATLLAGCSGSSDSINSGSSVASPSSTLSGTAAKGIIKQAKVTAEELVGTTWTLRGEATTDNNGDYTLTMSGYTNGVVRVTVTPTASTRMVCDAPNGCISADGSTTPLGSDATLATDFSMKSVVPPVTTTDNKAYVTPLTDMVAANLEQNPAGINSDTVKQKTSQVAAAFALGDILRTKPVNINTNNGDQNQDNGQQIYITALAAIAKMMYENSTNATGTTQALTKIRNSFLDGSFDTNTDSFSARKGVREAFFEAALEVSDYFVKTGKINEIVKTSLINYIAENDPSKDYTPPVVETAVANDIDKAKAIVAQARALSTSLTSMQTPAQSFGTQLETVNKVWNDRSSLLGLLLTEIIQNVGGQLGNTIKTAVSNQEVNIQSTQRVWCNADNGSTLTVATAASVQKSTCSVIPNYVNGYPSSTPAIIAKVNVSVADTANGLQVTVTKPMPVSGDLVPAVNLVFTLPNFTVADLSANTKALSGASIIVNGTITDNRATMTLNNITAATTFANAYNMSESNPDMPTITVASLKGGISLVDKTSGGSFTGNAELSMVQPASPAQPTNLSISKVTLDGTFSNASNNVKAAATFNLTNAASFDLTAFSQHESIKRVETFGIQPANVANLAKLATSAGVPDNANIYSTYYYANRFSYTNNGLEQIVNKTCFSYEHSSQYGTKCTIGDVLGFGSVLQSSVPNANYVELLYADHAPQSNFNYSYGNATFPDFESANNFAQGNLTLSLDANLADFPNTVATVTVDRQGYPDIGTAVVSLKQQSVNRGLTISASNSVANGASNINALTVTSLDGTTMTLNKSATGGIQGTIKVGNTTVADIIDMKGWTKVSFKDGTFESF